MEKTAIVIEVYTYTKSILILPYSIKDHMVDNHEVIFNYLWIERRQVIRQRPSVIINHLEYAVQT